MSGPSGRIWALGDYPAIARDVLAPLGPELVAACGVGPGKRVLDVGAGTGNAAIAAALAGADVVALDPVAELIDVGREEAAAQGVELEWVLGDAQALPQDDGEFDVVLSCLGAMFAPDHETTASELLRVCRPGGVIGLVAWHPPGVSAELMRVVGGYAPPPPAGAGSPIAWGDEEHLRELFGDGVSGMESHVGVLHGERFGTPEEVAAFFCASFPPAVGLAAQLPPDRVAALHADIGTWAGSAVRNGGLELEYLLTVATRAG
jgi:SAM-dependent methyltransferase